MVKKVSLHNLNLMFNAFFRLRLPFGGWLMLWSFSQIERTWIWSVLNILISGGFWFWQSVTSLEALTLILELNDLLIKALGFIVCFQMLECRVVLSIIKMTPCYMLLHWAQSLKEQSTDPHLKEAIIS